MLRTYRNLPPIATGYPLDDVWSVVAPITRTNEVANPSAELGTTTGYTTGAGTLTTTTTQQYHGARSFQYTPSAATTDGFYYTLSSTIALRAISCKFRGVANVPYALTYATSAGVDLITKPFVASGRWQWVVLYYNDASATTRRLYFRKNGSTSVAIYYVDGVQSEVIATGETASTYIDGDQLGLVPNQQPPAYFWNGTPHASTSTRSGQTRAGGMVIPFKKYGFLITALIGLGMAGVQNIATDYARIDGAYDDYTRKPPRQFTITGRFQGRTYAELRRNRSGLAQLLDRDLIGQDQRLTLLRHVEDRNGNVVSSTVRTLAKYESGLGGSTDNMHAETAPITFTQYLPAIGSDGEDGEALNTQTSISNGLRILQRSASGVWGPLSTGANANVWSLFYASDGKLYAGGEFTSIGGVAANRIAYWDGTAWNAMGTGMAGAAGTAVYSIVEGSDGAIYAAGDGTGFGGIANTAGLGKWSGGVWSSITTTASANAGLLKLQFGPDGVLYAAGAFTTINGVAAVRIAQRSVAGTWTAMAGGSANDVFGMAMFGHRLYITGRTSGGGNSEVSYWTGSAWVVIGAASAAATLRALAITPNGTVYASGDFTTLGGIAAVGVAQFNGTAWSALGSGVAGGSASGYTLQVLPDGSLLVGGSFTSAGGITTVNNLARWNGSAWVYMDVDIGWTSVRASAQKVDGTLAIGGTGLTSTGSAGANTTITNLGTARAYPTVTINGPSSGTSRIYQITNYTTGRTIYLNLTMSLGETATLVFQPDNLSFTSDFQGNIAGAILGGSNEADFFLQPGANAISFFSADSTVAATIAWRTMYASIDDVP